MRSPVGLSTCPNCQAIYQVLKVEGGPDAKDEEGDVSGLQCPLPARQGLKHHLLQLYAIAEYRSAVSERLRTSACAITSPMTVTRAMNRAASRV